MITWPPHDYPYYWVILHLKSKEDKVKLTNLKNSPQFYVTHQLKLLDNVCKYEMDLTSIVEYTKWTRFCPQTDRRTRWNQYTPFSISLKRGYNHETETHLCKNIYRHIVHTIVSWPNPKQWVKVHTSALMMIIRQSIYSLNHHKGDG